MQLLSKSPAGRFVTRLLIYVIGMIILATGIVQAIADFLHQKVGDVKNFFDAFCVLTTLVLGWFGFHRIVGLGIGSVAAMLGVGRVIALVNHFYDPSPLFAQEESTGA